MTGIQDPSYNLSDLTHTMPLMQPKLPTIAKIYVMTSHFQDFTGLFTLPRMPFHTSFCFKQNPCILQGPGQIVAHLQSSLRSLSHFLLLAYSSPANIFTNNHLLCCWVCSNYYGSHKRERTQIKTYSPEKNRIKECFQPDVVTSHGHLDSLTVPHLLTSILV